MARRMKVQVHATASTSRFAVLVSGLRGLAGAL